MLEMAKELLRQMFRKPYTNLFPAKRAPDKAKALIEKAVHGKAWNTHVPVPEGYRGRIEYYREKCIGCRLCIKVCPANCFDYLEKERKVHYHLSRCTFCAQCVDTCPVKALATTKDFLLADYKKQ
jgi:formate hydrogenlyase subunit 6/NADH:ubiquinone oxidoreductase subunit I